MSKLDDHFTDAERKIMDSQPIPQKAIDALPKGYTILGWGGEFEFGEKYNPCGIQYWDCHFGVWFEDEDEASPNDSPGCIFAAPTDSEIVERNATRDKLPVSGQKDPSICNKNTKPSALPTDDAGNATMKRKSIYIAGPMRGISYFNFPAFDAAHDKLEDEGWNAVSPADLDREQGFDALDLLPTSDWNDLSTVPFNMKDCFDRDICAVSEADAIYMLKGWQNSTGAQAEFWCAKWLGKEIHYEEETICEEAFRIQGGDRQQDYGDPTQNFQDIANLWNEYMHVANVNELTARDIAHMMILMKIARNSHKPKRDNWTDIAGYAQCGGKIDKV